MEKKEEWGIETRKERKVKWKTVKEKCLNAFFVAANEIFFIFEEKNQNIKH